MERSEHTSPRAIVNRLPAATALLDPHQARPGALKKPVRVQGFSSTHLESLSVCHLLEVTARPPARLAGF